ncbi:MAG: hypothetical protein ACRYGP_02000 [Janthinobacterium lividum]
MVLMTQLSMVARVAAALAADDGRSKDPSFYLSAARVAIEEMRRPTSEMRRRGDESRSAGDTAGMIYMAMTDEAARDRS